METIKSILHKINRIAHSDTPLTLIEKDLMLGLTRNLYEEISELVFEKTTSVEQDSLPLTEEQTPTIQDVENTLENVIEDTEVESNFEFDEDADFIDDPSMAAFIEKTEPLSLSESDSISAKQNITEHLSSSTVQQATEIRELKDPKNVLDFKLWNKDIRSYIGINDKYNFISELFGNNAESYEEILNEINLCGNKAEVLQFLENSGITTLYKWDEDGFSAQAFYGVLSQFFATK